MAPRTDADRPGHHLRPVLTVLAFLVPMVFLTVYYYDQSQPAPFVPSNILVLALLNVDVILLVLLALLLSRRNRTDPSAKRPWARRMVACSSCPPRSTSIGRARLWTTSSGW